MPPTGPGCGRGPSITACHPTIRTRRRSTIASRCIAASLRDHSPDTIIVGGSSAGGNLAAALIVRARDEGLPLPRAAVLLSPELDLTESGDSFQANMGVDSVLVRSLMPANRLYAGGHDLAHPYVSPLFADFTKGFPPTFVQAGTRDLFLSNAVRMHRKLLAAGVAAELHVFEAMPHGGFFGAPEDAELRGPGPHLRPLAPGVGVLTTGCTTRD